MKTTLFAIQPISRCTTKGLLSLGCVFLLLLCMAVSAKPAPRYRFAEIGISYPLAINNAGDVVGYLSGPLLYHRGVVTSIPLGGDALAINASGDVLIRMELHAFVWAQGTAHPLAVEDLWTRASGMNNAGVVVGRAGVSQPCVAVVWSNYCCYRILGTLGEGYSSDALDINNRGQIVGVSWPTDSGVGRRWNRPVMFHDGRIEDLGLPDGAIEGTAIAINDAGQVLVNCIMSDNSSRVFIHSCGKFTDLGVIPGGYSAGANAINNSGQVVGGTQIGNEFHAFHYSDGQMHDLNDLVQLPSGTVLVNGTGINDRGEIVGLAKGIPWRGFLLTPGVHSKAVPKSPNPKSKIGVRKSKPGLAKPSNAKPSSRTIRRPPPPSLQPLSSQLIPLTGARKGL